MKPSQYQAGELNLSLAFSANPSLLFSERGRKMINPIKTGYAALASSEAYKSVDLRLKVISWSVATISAISTAYSNGFSHRASIGIPWAIILAVLTLAVVEGSLYTIEEGLRSTFKGGTQRALAWAGKWIIKSTMIGNAMYLCCVIAAVSIPHWLILWNRWSFVVHFAVGLVLVPMIRDSDPVIANRMLQLRAETAQEDQIIARVAGALSSPFVMLGIRIRGALDGLSLGWKLANNTRGFKPSDYVANLNDLADSQFGYIHGRTTIPKSPANVLAQANPILRRTP